MKVKFIFPILFLALATVSCKHKDEPDEARDDQSGQNEENIDPSDQQGQDEVPGMPAQNGSGETNGYTLVWQDTFDGDAVDETAWNIEVVSNPANNELQYYTRNNVTIETDPASGRRCMVLTARKETYGGRTCTSGRVNSKQKKYFKYGKVEAMVKLPKTYKGLWPAFWMMGNDFNTAGWPACGELDIFEMGHSGGFGSVAKSESYLNGATHCAPKGKWDQDNCQYHNATWSYSLQDDFHLFTCIWDQNSINCYIDLDKYPGGSSYFTLNISQAGHEIHNDLSCWDVYCYFHKEFFILFNLAVGGDFPGIKNISGITALNEANNYQAKMMIDYVRVYQK